MRAAEVFLLNAVAPILGLLVAIPCLSPGLSPDTFGSDLVRSGQCALSSVFEGEMVCEAPIGFGWLAGASIAGLAFASAMMIANRLGARLLGVNRSVLAMGFAPFTFLNMTAILLVGVGNIALVAGIALLATSHWLQADATIVLGLLGLTALSLIWAVASQGLAFFKLPKSYARAKPVNLLEQPRLGRLIRDVAKRTNARMPDNVIIGLEPSFYATNAQVVTPYHHAPLKGETLHLSLPLMTLLSTGELRAVIGHELGHFSGDDTAYTVRFAPALAGLYGAVRKVRERSNSITGLFLAPPRALLEDFAQVFGALHGRISRERERRADRLGARASSPEDVAYSLLKSSLGGLIWRGTLEGLIDRARRGRFSRNLVRCFSDQIRFDVDRRKLTPALQDALRETPSHPTDAHPPTDARIASLGLHPAEVMEEDRLLARFFGPDPAIASLDNLSMIEEDLTTLYYHLLKPDWAPLAPKEKDAEEVFLSLMADFLAYMVTIDGSIDDREIVVAEAAALRMFGAFDCDGFRERCRHPADIPHIDRMVELANILLSETGVANLKSALRKVAEADGKITPEEERLMRRIEGAIHALPENDTVPH